MLLLCIEAYGKATFTSYYRGASVTQALKDRELLRERNKNYFNKLLHYRLSINVHINIKSQ